MNVTSKPARYEQHGVKTYPCDCCGREQQFIGGAVYDQNDELLAVFGATLQAHCDSHKWVGLRLGLKLEDDVGALLEPKSFSLILTNRDDVVGTSVVTGPPDPGGLGLTREEALKSPFISLIYEIDDFIIDKEPSIRAFLHCD